MNRPRLKTRGQWRKGPPPSSGWWPASYYRNVADIRWWDGANWSIPCKASMTAMEAESRAKFLSMYPFDIEWTERPSGWPERSKT